MTPIKITPALLRHWPLPKLDPAAGKEGRGQILVVGGSVENPGAVLLAALGALRAGAGKLEIATSRDVAKHVGVAFPEARVRGLANTRAGEVAPSAARSLDEDIADADAVLVGPGMMDPRGATAILQRASQQRARASFVVDAGALTAYEDRPPRLRAVLTPHAGEMAKLCDLTKRTVTARPLELACEMAKRLHAVVALKGAITYVANPDGRSWVNTAGNVGLGTSGSGDTLAGVIAGLCARGAKPDQAAVWGVYLHARAGDLLAREMGPLGFLARDLLTKIPRLLAQVTNSSSSRPSRRR
jgi:ADP-dependent NAD(P)H-hydrate dehydratase